MGGEPPSGPGEAEPGKAKPPEPDHGGNDPPGNPGWSPAIDPRRRVPRAVSGTIDIDTRDEEITEQLARLALSDPETLLAGLEARSDWQAQSGLDARIYSLVKIAALIALDAPPASYLWQVSNALAAGCTPADLLGVLQAVAPQVGGPRTVAAAPELMLALGLSLPEGLE